MQSLNQAKTSNVNRNSAGSFSWLRISRLEQPRARFPVYLLLAVILIMTGVFAGFTSAEKSHQERNPFPAMEQWISNYWPSLSATVAVLLAAPLVSDHQPTSTKTLNQG